MQSTEVQKNLEINLEERAEQILTFDQYTEVKIVIGQIDAFNVAESLARSIKDPRTGIVDHGTFAAETIALAIVRWEGIVDKQTQQPLPINAAIIRKLPPAIQTKLSAHVLTAEVRAMVEVLASPLAQS